MAANSIGNASLVLSTNGTQLLSGLTDTAKGIKGWSDRVQAGVAGAAVGIAGKVTGVLSNSKALFAGAGTAIGTMIGGPLGGAIGSVVGGAAGGIVETIFGAITAPLDKLEVFKDLSRDAKALGMSASQLQGLQIQLKKVGIEGDSANQVFVTMGKNIADAAGGHGRAAPALAQLGIDAKALMSLPLDEQFKRIADEISKLPQGAAQASAAMHIFGGEGGKMLSLLQKGSGGIQEFIEAGKKTGAILGDSQIKSAAEAAKAWKESKTQISLVWDGLVNRATMVAAPIVKFLGQAVSKVFTLLLPVFDWLGRAISKVADILSAVFTVLIEWVSEAVKFVGDLAGEWLTFGTDTQTVEQVVLAVCKSIGVGFGYVWDALKAGAGVISWVVGKLINGFGKVIDAFKDTLVSLLEQAAELPDALGGDKFKDAANALKGWGNPIKDNGNAMIKWGENAMGSFGESAAKIGTWFDKLANKRKEEAEKAKADAEEITQSAKYSKVGALMEGSKEAYSVETKFRWDSKFGEQKKVDEKQLDEQKKMNKKLDKLIDKPAVQLIPA